MCSMLNQPCHALAQAAESHDANGLPCRPNGPHTAVLNIKSAKPAGIGQLFRHKHGTGVQGWFSSIKGSVSSREL